ncbi:MAG: 16S rRNA (adenine(1518)-N(6)/adenine(1519)-N(6))-dimethyltransferase RsmA [Proteobacteria bacterium]|nr:16S rRNA (adenine(1518)-N(6)/adenine(1519)-N(6))-dimethyltransferase RsmA [Pseudomonadota bacterium]
MSAPALSGPSDGLPPLAEIVRRHGLAARKSLGQHFIFDLNLTRRIARAAGDLAVGTTIEVGPGPGGLTRGLLAEGAAKVVAIERDARALPALAEIAAFYPGRLEIVEADALEIDAAALGTAPRRIVANLPYNVGTPMLLRWLGRPDAFECIVVMLQKEVVERLVAPPDGEAYGRLAVATQWHWTARRLFDVAPGAFSPPPAVVSAVVELRPRPAPLAPADARTLERVTAAAFGKRRKMLRQSLKSLGHDPLLLCAEAGIDPTRRAETLSIEEFCALARAVSARRAGA